MMYKFTLTFSLLFFAIAGSAQSDGGAIPSAQPPSNFSSVASQVYPSATPISNPPTGNYGNSSQTNGTRPSGCHHHHSAIPTDQPQPPSSGVFSSMSYSATPVSSSDFTCQPDYESTIPTGTASVPPFSGGAFPTTNVSGPLYTNAPNGTYSGSFTLPTPSFTPFASGPDEQNPPASNATATASHVGRRMLVRRQV